MKNILASVALSLVLSTGAVFAQEAGHNEAEPTHFPIHKPTELSWSFSGPFGTYDKAQLQRGLKVYKEVCSACHSMKQVAFRTLEELGYNEEQVKSFAAEYEVQDGPNAEGDMFTRKGGASDYFPSPFANPEAAAAANNGAVPSRSLPRRAAWSAGFRCLCSTSPRNMPKAAQTTSMHC
jgi:ubiquinol-cytochrome c reductase cytochrome c1 subunit